MSVGPRRRDNPIRDWGVRLGIVAGESTGSGVGREQRRQAPTAHPGMAAVGVGEVWRDTDTHASNPEVPVPAGTWFVAGTVSVSWPSAPGAPYYVSVSRWIASTGVPFLAAEQPGSTLTDATIPFSTVIDGVGWSLRANAAAFSGPVQPTAVSLAVEGWRLSSPPCIPSPRPPAGRLGAP